MNIVLTRKQNLSKNTHTKVSSYERRTVQKFMATEMKEELLRKMHEIRIVNLFMLILNMKRSDYPLKRHGVDG